jgi:hypothetical protein
MKKAGDRPEVKELGNGLEARGERREVAMFSYSL